MTFKRDWTLPVVFLSGAAVLAYEIAGARLLSPVFGSTLPVWSSIFAATLLSLSAGYALGGLVATRLSPERVLGISLSLAALWITAVPWMRYGLLTAAMGWGVFAGAVGAALFFLGPPLLMLGMTGPVILRLRAKDENRVGRDTGGVSAVSTAGSVVGALAAGYILIPRLSGLTTTAVLGSVVALLAAFIWSKARRPGLSAALVMIAVTGPFLFSLRETRDYGTVLEKAESFYGSLRVMDHASWGKRVLYIDGIANTVADIETFESTSDYISGIELAVFMRPPERMRKALLIGLGGGSLVGRLDRFYGIKTDVVEIDAAVARLAVRWFGLAPTGTIAIEDARTYLSRGGNRYDIVIGDAFSGDTHPAHLFTVEAFTDVKRSLAADGILVMNVIGFKSGPEAGLKRAVAKTLKTVFENVYAVPANQGVDIETDPINMIFYASDGPLEFVRDPVDAPRRELGWFYHSVRRKRIPLEDAQGELITDARNPVNRLNASVFVGIRARIFAARGRLLLD